MSRKVTDHAEIQAWASRHNMVPARVQGTGDQRDGGLLRFMDANNEDDNLTEISWDEFFTAFDQNNLALLIDEDSERFNKLVSR